MADVHASARLRNVERTVLVSIAPRIPAPVVPDGDEKFDSSTAPSGYVRVSFQPMPETPAGRVTDSGTTRRTTRATFLLVAECFAQGNGMGPGATVDGPEALAEQVAHVVRYLDLPLVDYVTDPTGATAVSGVAVRFTDPPHVQRVPPSDGWHRRIVTAEGHWFLRHAE